MSCMAKCLPALGSSGFLSGWHFKACFLYDFTIYAKKKCLTQLLKQKSKYKLEKEW